jgi:uncharacterized protein (TIGR02466 family)
MKQFELVPLFSVPMYISNIHIDDSAGQFVKTISYEFIGNGHSSIDKNILNAAELSTLKASIEQEIEFYVRNQLHVAKHISFEIINSWVMLHRRDNFSPPHSHNCSLLSGIIYIDTDEDSGDITFIRGFGSNNLFPSALDLEVSEYNIFNSNKWRFRPHPGEIVIFPSFLGHEVGPSQSDHDRYCIAFNVFPRGILNLGTMNELKL